MTVKIAVDGRGRSPFTRPNFGLSSTRSSNDAESLTSLPDLVEFNACHNPTHTFCIQHGLCVPPRVVSFEDLYHAVLRCSTWLGLRGLAQTPSITQNEIVKARPVAILMASDVGWFVTFLALLRLGVPVLCLSTRLAPQAVANLVHSTHTQAILVSSQVDTLVHESTCLFSKEHGQSKSPSVHLVPPFAEFLDPSSDLDCQHVPPPPQFEDVARDAVILHSSGSTGLPKPIFHSQAYLLGYASCHKLSARDVEGAVNVSTLPLYHGFGQLAPCLSLAVGMPFALLSANTIPTGPSTLDILTASNATSLMTVPSILEELYLLPDRIGCDAMKTLRFVAVGGAPMKQSVAKSLAQAGVPLLNHWGVTEVGPIAPIFVPDADYDWRYLRVRDDFGLRFEQVEEEEEDNDTSGLYRLVGCPPGTTEEFVVQDLLEVNPKNPTTEFRIAGRADDLIVLATGEKVRPTLLEHHVSEDPLVRGTVVFGDGKFHLGLIVEAAPSCVVDLNERNEVEAFVDGIWASVERGNRETDKHGRVSREMIIVTTPSSVPLIRTPKGSIPRAENARLFQVQIDELYARADVAGAKPLPIDDPSRLQDAVRHLVLASFPSPRAFTDSDDFFERGMDSLQATMLRRRLTGAMSLTSPTLGALPSDIVYANPSVLLLCDALLHCYHDRAGSSQDRLAHVRRTMEEWVRKVGSLEASRTPSSSTSSTTEGGAVVLLTGSTGSLGSALLHTLASLPHIVKIHALNRKGGDIRRRQEAGLRKLGVDYAEVWQKVELHEGDLSAVHFGLDDSTYSRFRDVTHIVHNAWPMDFNRSLQSFRPHLEGTLNIIKLALHTHHTTPVRLLFSSSIAVVGRYPLLTSSPSSSSSAAIPETTLDNPSMIDHFGYAEAKWVCERMFEEASHLYKDKLVSTNVRIGQMTGGESSGAWNVAEHIPMLVKSCVAVGKVPDIQGTASWIPVDKAASVVSEVLFSSSVPSTPVIHLENPVRQSWTHILTTFSSRLGLQDRIPFAEWLKLVEMHGRPEENPSVKILPFLREEFLRMATGQVVLDTTEARKMSRTLAGCGEVGDEVLVKYADYWGLHKASSGL